MAELEENQPPAKDSAEAPKEKKPAEKPTVVDIKFSLTKRKKIVIALIAAFTILLASVLTIWFTDLKYTVFGLFTKATAEVVVADSKTLQPIEGAEVKIDNQTEKTNKEGKATLKNLVLGKKRLKVTKEAYKDFQRSEVIFIGTNKLEPVRLEGTGIPISFIVKNKITNVPIEDVSLTVGKNKVRTAKDGTAIITVLPQADVKAVAKISKKGYVDSSLKFEVEKNLEPISTTLTPEGKNYFLSNRSGKIDLYESGLDGTGQKVILAATGNEEDNTAINTSPDNKWVALLSTREGIKGASGNFIPLLYLINPKDKSLSKIGAELNISILGWAGSSLIYNTNNGKYSDGFEAKIVAYNASLKKSTPLVTSSDYTSITQIFSDKIIYSLPDKTTEKFGLFMINADGSGLQKIINESVYTVYKTTTFSGVFQSADSNKWYSYNTGTKKLDQLSAKPPGLKTKDFIASPSKNYTAFVETRDGKRELYLADREGKDEKKRTIIGSVYSPIRWVGEDYIIFRFSSSDETADYIVGRKAGDPLKIEDVYNPPSSHGY